MRNNRISNIIYRGCWTLDKELEEHDKYYRISPLARSPIFVHNYSNKGQFPYQYYQNYLKKGGVDFYSGVGHHHGIARGNEKNLRETGYKGCFFYFNDENIKAWDKYT